MFYLCQLLLLLLTVFLKYEFSCWNISDFPIIKYILHHSKRINWKNTVKTIFTISFVNDSICLYIKKNEDWRLLKLLFRLWMSSWLKDVVHLTYTRVLARTRLIDIGSDQTEIELMFKIKSPISFQFIRLSTHLVDERIQSSFQLWWPL